MLPGQWHQFGTGGARVVSGCERCRVVYDGSPVGGAYEVWLRKHRRTQRCKREVLAAGLYARGLAPFDPRPELPGVPFEVHPTDAPEEARLWGVTPLPRYELRGRSGGQRWRPLWVRVVADCYEVLLAGWEPGAAQRRQPDPGTLGLARAYRDQAVERLLREPETAEAVASVFLLERQRLLDQHGDLLRVAAQAPLLRPWEVLRALGMPGSARE